MQPTVRSDPLVNITAPKGTKNKRLTERIIAEEFSKALIERELNFIRFGISVERVK